MYGNILARQWFYQYNIEGSRRIVKHECWLVDIPTTRKNELESGTRSGTDPGLVSRTGTREWICYSYAGLDLSIV